MSEHDARDTHVHQSGEQPEGPTSDVPSSASRSERRLARLVVPAPTAYASNHRIDWQHDPELTSDPE